MQALSSDGGPNGQQDLSAMPCRLHARVAVDPQDDGRAAAQGQLPELHRRAHQARAHDTEALHPLRRRGAGPPHGLRPSATGDLAVPPMSS